jgi:hypothetical protein
MRGARLLALCLVLSSAATAVAQAQAPAGAVREVAIDGYTGIVMEPFVSRDGRFLLFNNSNDPRNDTDLFYARRVDDFHWTYVGPIGGVNTPALEGTPTMDRDQRLFFVSTRSYARTSCTIHTARFDDGRASDVQLVDSICRHEPGIVNFDVDIDASGTLMTFVDSRFGRNGQPQDAVLVMARRDGARFVRDADSARLLAPVNGPGLQYAPCLSADHLTLWFTRVGSVSGADSPQIWRARRSVETVPFDAPVRFEGLGDFVEAPALSPDEKLLYFHRRTASGFRLFVAPLQ